jgi:hypothetical protein
MPGEVAGPGDLPAGADDAQILADETALAVGVP